MNINTNKNVDVVQVKLGNNQDKSYEILITTNGFDLIANDLKKLKASKYIIITDSNVFEHLGERFLEIMRLQGLDTVLLTFKAGEQSKSLSTYSKLCKDTLSAGADRKSIIIALGGGVVGDIAGFVASTYMRGIPFVQIPTTLLAMVDSSVGGKVGVDFEGSKNFLGSFWQPKRVYMDINILSSLPDVEIKNGFSEVVKTACIYDSIFFGFLENNVSKIMEKDTKALTQIVKRCVEIKSEVVGKDEREDKCRIILNYGHTIGHAVETSTTFQISHGQAIAIGMNVSAKIAEELNVLSEKDVIRQNKLLSDAGIDIKLPHNIKPKELMELAKLDKKTEKGKIQFVLLSKIGKVYMEGESHTVSPERKLVLNVLKRLLKDF